MSGSGGSEGRVGGRARPAGDVLIVADQGTLVVPGVRPGVVPIGSEVLFARQVGIAGESKPVPQDEQAAEDVAAHRALDPAPSICPPRQSRRKERPVRQRPASKERTLTCVDFPLNWKGTIACAFTRYVQKRANRYGPTISAVPELHSSWRFPNIEAVAQLER